MNAKPEKKPVTGPEVGAFIGILTASTFLIGAALASFIELRKSKIAAEQDEALRRLVGRYESLAEGTLDAQQRTAGDVSELRARTASIEQILRTVE